MKQANPRLRRADAGELQSFSTRTASGLTTQCAADPKHRAQHNLDSKHSY